MPKISICIPTHNMKNKEFFLQRALDSIRSQTFQDYEIVITEKGRMAENTNAAIKEATGTLVKILYMDDWLAHPDALQDIWNNFEFTDDWMITGADTNPHPYWTDDIETGNNKLGSPSALTMRRGSAMMFDERMSWLLDCDLYRRMYDEYGPPKIIDSVGVNIGVGDHQMTHILTDEEKLAEHKLIRKKYK
jgi:hypothetical protein